MNKEEILAKSRNENKKKDPLQKEVSLKGANLALVVSAIFAGILYLTEMIITGAQNNALWATLSLMDAVIWTYMGLKLNKSTYIAAGIIWGFVAVITTVLFIIEIKKRSIL